MGVPARDRQRSAADLANNQPLATRDKTMSYAAKRNFSTRKAALNNLVRDEFATDSDYDNRDESYDKAYFLGKINFPGWRRARGLHVEVPFQDCVDTMKQEVYAALDSLENAPEWEHGNLTIGFAYGGTQLNFLLWQGRNYWHINDVLGI